MTKTAPANATAGSYSVNTTATSGTSTGTGSASVTVLTPPLTVTLSVPSSTVARTANVPITATVLQGSTPVANATVVYTVVRPDQLTQTTTLTTNSSGQTTWNYIPWHFGTYSVTAVATYGSQTATASAITFTAQ